MILISKDMREPEILILIGKLDVFFFQHESQGYCVSVWSLRGRLNILEWMKSMTLESISAATAKNVCQKDSGTSSIEPVATGERFASGEDSPEST